MQLLYKNSQNNIQIDADYNFDISKMELVYQNKILDLTIQQKELLYLLIKNIGSIVPPDIIKDYIWDDREVCDNTLRTQIKKLRSKLKNNFIINIRNSGYKIEKYENIDKVSNKNKNYKYKILLSFFLFSVIVLITIIIIHLEFSKDNSIKKFKTESHLQSEEKINFLNSFLQKRQDSLLAI